MIEAIQSFFALKWTQEPLLRPLPPHIVRNYVQTPNGNLELLSSKPDVKSAGLSSRKQPIFFVHGGEGSGSVWFEWMEHLSTSYNATTYAYSLRCHGASYSVPYWKMVWGTSLDDLASDLVACIQDVREREGQDPIIVAHSSGGGLSQYVLSKSLVKARGLVLVGAVPHWGNMSVYFSWFRRIDPWFSLRSLCHLFHPNSPLNTPRLVHNAFFGPQYPRSRVPEFMRWMSNYEAMFWPFGMAGRGWGIENRSWLATTDILSNIVQWNGSQKILVMIGTDDKMMGGTETRMVREYCSGIQQMQVEKRIDADYDSTKPSIKIVRDKYVNESDYPGVRLVEVKGAGHHTQNDMQWEEAAEALRRFSEQLD
ncbi:hypothetical protein LTR84_007459 [Exophiala bonariae]|uniref:AB hydrolase-1 domain-containing protein n=1 Tax=Exophiala bonariae TaxID=1690606 RepID=A0AAV9MYA7_9EURO|nr:hypothetical protein LTR84_007459 [Exophiala bonariae]